MPQPEGAFRRQKAVLWPATGRSDEFGQPRVGDPEELDVRWSEKKSEALDPAGNTVSLDAQAVVAQDVKPGSRMWLGELADWYGTGSATTDDEVMEVVTFSRAPDVKNRAVARTVGLRRFRDIPQGTP